MTASRPVDEQLGPIRRDAVEAIPEDELARKLEFSRETGVGLIVRGVRPGPRFGCAIFFSACSSVEGLGQRVIRSSDGREVARMRLEQLEPTAESRAVPFRVAAGEDAAEVTGFTYRLIVNGQVDG